MGESTNKEIKYFNSIQGWRIELLENSNSDDDLPH